MMRNCLKFFVLLTVFSASAFGQLYIGPVSGSVPSGVLVSTNGFQKVQAIKAPYEKYETNKGKYELLPGYLESVPPSKPEGSNFIQDKNADISAQRGQSGISPLLLTDFQGLPDQGSFIPPDPYMAAGATQLIGVVNTRFRVFDKIGNVLKTIEAVDWYRSAITGGSIYDPKISYDHFAKRWLMVWLQVDEATQRSNFLVSVSRDSSAIGEWYNYVLPGSIRLNDTLNTWADYQGVGFDSVAVYFTSNQFNFGTSQSFRGSRIRIINKSELYSNTGGPVTYTDLYDLRVPTVLSQRTFGIRPSVVYTQSNDYYLMVQSAYSTATYFTVYKITNPLNNPVMTAYNVPVTTYTSAANPKQLGGASIDLEGGGFTLRNEPIVRDGYMWGVHSVNGNGGSNVRYIKINLKTSLAEEDYAFGSNGFYHFYPAMSVDKDHNILLAYSRVSANDFVGAYYTSKLNTDPAGTMSGNWLLKAGKANYMKTFSGTRNRWGDYNGCWLDPVDQNNFWVLTEYVDAVNTWGTWIGKIRLVPFAGAQINASVYSKDFGSIEKNTLSDTLSVTIKNFGSDNLVVSKISCNTPFTILNTLTYPLTLKTLDSILIKVQFRPVKYGIYSDTLKLTCNDSKFTGIPLLGKGFEINQAVEKVLYASTGKENAAAIALIDKNSGAGTNIGNSGFTEISNMSVNPKTKLIYGLVATATDAKIVRINPTLGDAYTLYSLSIANLAAIAFDTAGAFYLASKTGDIYNLDVKTGATTLLSNVKFTLSTIAVNPVNNQMWACNNAVVGQKDKIYKINPATGENVLVGRTNLNTLVTGLVFDEKGKFYGATGVSGATDNLISIDTATGAGTVVGSIGLTHITGFAYLAGKITDVQKGNEVLPDAFSLSQNYPNPFNPSTTINYTLPQNGEVKIVIYDILGKVVKTLVDANKNAGSYNVIWNSEDNSGQKSSSGIYFCEIKFNAENGTRFTDIKKMTLLK